MAQQIRVLGIESSCDDSAAAVLTVDDQGGADILSSQVADQSLLHAAFGGVVPEIAARAHTEKLDIVITAALADARLTLDDIDLVAVTSGPGLIGGVIAGVSYAKAIAAAKDLPIVGVNHLAGHALTPRMTDGLAFPYLLLLVSGGHCQFLLVKGISDFHRLGGTIDDAPGEAFDKTAKLLGLGYPGGPVIEAVSVNGDASRFDLPRPLIDRDDCDMSFSGLKTAVRRTADQLAAAQGGITAQDQADIAAGFQNAVADILVDKTAKALAIAGRLNGFAIAGGVAANKQIGDKLRTLAARHDLPFVQPPMQYCTDNAAMIAYAGALKFMAGQSEAADLIARPRWPLDISVQPMLGSGKKGAKA
ncbi:MAG: tRNA (adenosine(37)-N6)-threonylcarbamoyltransferase complex transferase subunit TsaD [Pseudomonadota bacterium]